LLNLDSIKIIKPLCSTGCYNVTTALVKFSVLSFVCKVSNFLDGNRGQWPTSGFTDDNEKNFSYIFTPQCRCCGDDMTDFHFSTVIITPSIFVTYNVNWNN